MRDVECVEFLQWALPRLRLRWAGFRKVRRQSGKRIGRRLQELQLPSLAAYRTYLAEHPEEWQVLDGLCRVTISRFHRDRHTWEVLGQRILPDLAEQAVGQGRSQLECWCVGCASGEEPYTLSLLWEHALRASYPTLDFHILATDASVEMLARARRGIYPASSLRDLPAAWRETSFLREGKLWRLAAGYRAHVEFAQHDVRRGAAMSAASRFALVTCRNLAFTYFAEELQLEVLRHLERALLPGGLLLVGGHERLPSGAPGFAPTQHPGFYARTA
jgi:chemotaxis protein methyltransferase CheR